MNNSSWWKLFLVVPAFAVLLVFGGCASEEEVAKTEKKVEQSIEKQVKKTEEEAKQNIDN